MLLLSFPTPTPWMWLCGGEKLQKGPSLRFQLIIQLLSQILLWSSECSKLPTVLIVLYLSSANRQLGPTFPFPHSFNLSFTSHVILSCPHHVPLIPFSSLFFFHLKYPPKIIKPISFVSGHQLLFCLCVVLLSQPWVPIHASMRSN